MVLLVLFALVAGAATAVTPCVLPVLPALLSASAVGGRRRPLGIVLGLAVTFTVAVLALGGRRLADRVRRAGRGLVLQRAMGTVMILTALAMATMLDVRFQNALAKHLPAALVDPTSSLENSHSVQSRLAGLRGRARFDIGHPGGGLAAAVRRPGGLPVLGTAPDFASPGPWLNTDGKRVTLASLRGRVVLVDFWT